MKDLRDVPSNVARDVQEMVKHECRRQITVSEAHRLINWLRPRAKTAGYGWVYRLSMESLCREAKNRF